MLRRGIELMSRNSFYILALQYSDSSKRSRYYKRHVRLWSLKLLVLIYLQMICLVTIVMNSCKNGR